MKHAGFLIAALAFAPTLVLAQGKPPRGTIAVIPFGVGAPTMGETATAFSVAVENALQASGRFVAVLPRSGDSAIKAELAKSTEPATLQSVVKIAQDAQLNANYVLSGWIVGQEAKPGKDPARGTPGFTAEARVSVRIIDVSTGAMVISEIIPVPSGQTLDVCPDGFSGTPCRALNEGKKRWMYPTAAEALNSLRTNGNAQSLIQKTLTEKLGYVLLDLIEESGKPVLIIRAAGGDPRKGTKLQAVQSRTSGLTGTSYTTPLGKVEITDVSGETATGTITDGADKIIKALKDQQIVLIVKG